jgi:hypothetical protein
MINFKIRKLTYYYRNDNTKIIINVKKEILKIESKRNRFKVKNEPPFVKLYLDNISVLANVSKSCGSVLLEFLPYMTYADDGNLIKTNIYYKEKISKKLNISIDRINHILGELCKANVIKRQACSIYIINPDYITRGSWSDTLEVEEIYDNLS